MSANSFTFLPSALPDKDDIPLTNAPLTRVLIQVRFPSIFLFDKQDSVEQFYTSIKNDYPIARDEIALGIINLPQGIPVQHPEKVWNFSNIEGNAHIVLAKESLTFSTTFYKGRKKFFESFSTILKALEQHAHPAVVNRIGVRYINRLVDNALENITNMIRPEILGVVAEKFKTEEISFQSFSEIVHQQIEYPNIRLLANWGFLPKNSQHADIEPIEKKSWILNMDMFSNEQKTFVPKEILETAQAYAEKIHSFFRWVVTDEFIQFYGGKK